MMISEEALYAAAPEAAEKFLSALPDREDCVHDFSPDFEERTLQKLAAMRHASEKEQNKMSMNRTKKITLLAAAAVALLAVTVSAAVLWLTPAQVAEELNDPMLAEAFQRGWSAGPTSPSGAPMSRKAAPMPWCPWSGRTAHP